MCCLSGLRLLCVVLYVTIREPFKRLSVSRPHALHCKWKCCQQATQHNSNNNGTRDHPQCNKWCCLSGRVAFPASFSAAASACWNASSICHSPWLPAYANFLVKTSIRVARIRKRASRRVGERERERATPTLCSAQFRTARKSMQALLATRQAILCLNWTVSSSFCAASRLGLKFIDVLAVLSRGFPQRF